MPYITKKVLLDGVATTTTSAGVYIGDRMKVGLQYVVGGITEGNVVIRTEVSDDNVNWVAYNRLISNVAAGTAFTSVQVTSSQNQVAFVPAGDTFSYLRGYVNHRATGALVTLILIGVIGGE